MWYLKTIPKVAHFYWANSTLPFLRYLTIFSFKKNNPNWKIKVYRPKIKYNMGFTGENYINRLLEMDIELIEVNFNALGFDNSLPPFQADFLRWKLLSTQGGLWSDFDIIYFKPMENLIFNKKENEYIDTVVSLYGDLHSIGFLLSSPQNDFFNYINKKTIEVFDPLSPQCIGADFLNKNFPTLDSIKAAFSNLNPYDMGMNVIYPISTLEIFNNNDISYLKETAIGLHWYGGNQLTVNWVVTLNEHNYKDYDNIICQLISKVMEV